MTIRVFLENTDKFTAVDNNVSVIGATGGTQRVVMAAGVTGLLADANVERFDLSGNLADYRLIAIAGIGLQIQDAAGVVITTIPSINGTAGLTVAFANGSAVLTQTGGSAFALGGAAVSTTAAAAVVATLNAADVSISAAATSVVNTGGQTFALTSSLTADAIIGTAGNDTVNGPTGTVVVGDLIIDASTTDADVANLVLTASYTPTNISNIETVNLDWDAFGAAAYSLAGVTGSKAINLTSAKVGFLGSSSITAGASNVISSGAGMTGTMTVTGATTAITANAGSATGVSVTGTGTAIVNAGAATTSVTTSGFTTATVNAGTAATISVTDGAVATDATALTVNANAAITNATTGILTLNASAGNNLTMNAIGASLVVNGTGNIIINSTGLTAETVTNNVTGGTLSFVSSATTAQDVKKVAASLIQFTGNVNGALTFKTGANAELTAATVTLATITGSATAAEVVNLKASGAAITALGQAKNLETLNLTAAAPAVTGTDLTVSALTLDGNKLVVTGTNDVSLVDVVNTTGATAATIDASALVGNFTFAQKAASTGDILNVTGSATGTNSATFVATTVASGYTGGAGADTVVFAQISGAGVASATAVVGNGANSVTATALTTGDLVVIGGTGVDTVSAAALTTGNVSLQLGDGANVVTLGGVATLAGATINVVTGAGNDSITLGGKTAAGDKINLNLGAGTNTLNISEDDSLGTFTVSGLTTIAIGTSTATATVDASLLNGKTYEITGAGVATDVLNVTTATAGSYNFSGIVINQTLTKGLAGLSITGSAGNDTIVGTAGADTIASGGGIDTITGGAGVDKLTGGSGKDTFVFAAGDSGKTATTVDTITTFTTTVDKISLGLAGSATNYTEVDLNAVVAFAAADAVTGANAKFDGTVKYVYISNTNASSSGSNADAFLVYDSNGDKAADMLIQIVGGKALTFFEFGDITA